jgi:hypothetical protein
VEAARSKSGPDIMELSGGFEVFAGAGEGCDVVVVVGAGAAVENGESIHEAGSELVGSSFPTSFDFGSPFCISDGG